MPSSPGADGAQYDLVLEAVREQTHMLLGATIGFSEKHWAQPSGLPGWTRSHVAAHLVENARGLVRICKGITAHRATRMYASRAEKISAVERGALLGGMQLQIDLDTSASELQIELSQLQAKDTLVEVRPGDRMVAHHIPLARLYEVVVHSRDIGLEQHQSHVPPDIAVSLLNFEATRIGRRPDLPGIVLRADEDFTVRVGADKDFETVAGPALDLLLWLSRGIGSPQLRGAWDRNPLH